MARREQVRVTFTLSTEAHDRLKALADAKGGTMAEILREALRREVWLESILRDEQQQLFIRSEDRPHELQRVLSI